MLAEFSGLGADQSRLRRIEIMLGKDKIGLGSGVVRIKGKYLLVSGVSCGKIKTMLLGNTNIEKGLEVVRAQFHDLIVMV